MNLAAIVYKCKGKYIVQIHFLNSVSKIRKKYFQSHNKILSTWNLKKMDSLYTISYWLLVLLHIGFALRGVFGVRQSTFFTVCKDTFNLDWIYIAIARTIYYIISINITTGNDLFDYEHLSWNSFSEPEHPNSSP